MYLCTILNLSNFLDKQKKLSNFIDLALILTESNWFLLFFLINIVSYYGKMTKRLFVRYGYTNQDVNNLCGKLKTKLRNKELHYIILWTKYILLFTLLSSHKKSFKYGKILSYHDRWLLRSHEYGGTLLRSHIYGRILLHSHYCGEIILRCAM